MTEWKLNATCQVFWNAATVVHRGKYLALKTDIRKEEKCQIVIDAFTIRNWINKGKLNQNDQ